MGIGKRLAALAVLLTAATSTAVAAPPRADERASLLAVAAAADAAWSAGDSIGVADAYTRDATFVLGPDAELAGREAIRAWFREHFADRPSGQRLVTRVERINMLQPGLALVDGRMRVEQQQPDGTWLAVREYVSYGVVVRDGEHWRLHDLRAVPAPTAAATHARVASR